MVDGDAKEGYLSASWLDLCQHDLLYLECSFFSVLSWKSNVPPWFVHLLFNSAISPAAFLSTARGPFDMVSTFPVPLPTTAKRHHVYVLYDQSHFPLSPCPLSSPIRALPLDLVHKVKVCLVKVVYPDVAVLAATGVAPARGVCCNRVLGQ